MAELTDKCTKKINSRFTRLKEEFGYLLENPEGCLDVLRAMYASGEYEPFPNKDFIAVDELYNKMAWRIRRKKEYQELQNNYEKFMETVGDIKFDKKERREEKQLIETDDDDDWDLLEPSDEELSKTSRMKRIKKISI